MVLCNRSELCVCVSARKANREREGERERERDDKKRYILCEENVQ